MYEDLIKRLVVEGPIIVLFTVFILAFYKAVTNHYIHLAEEQGRMFREEIRHLSDNIMGGLREINDTLRLLLFQEMQHGRKSNPDDGLVDRVGSGTKASH